ncbi:ABC transporter permease [Nocardiopsis sp. CT-R113]|uniref:ABC transporter permease n=1 Tax=Nocardiopsis codii TaxID=3065942 RepID=A0ABU7KCA9_9ACTN|nr:ABC transporter permease [Nocardiopsis sp. CT-R113]MEE2039856.1 ABC transporter permease [Nocardiopsis sp. CT-R113]
MADLLSRTRESVVWPVRTYVLLAWTWCRALAQYPASLALMTLSTALGAFAEMGAVFVVFGHAGEISGFGMAEGLLIAGMATTAFACADMVMGMVESLGRHIRTGSLDVMLVRPVPPLVQIATDRFAPRRLGRIVPGSVVTVMALVVCDIDWTAGKVLMLPVLLVSGTAICCAIWIIGACLQFFVADAREAANSITYGGQALTEYPMAIYSAGVVRAATFVLPLAFVTWQPALYLLDRPDPTGLPGFLRFATPFVAVALCAVAAAFWRFGLRRYRSTGS